jgi:hypothetical protein
MDLQALPENLARGEPVLFPAQVLGFSDSLFELGTGFVLRARRAQRVDKPLSKRVVRFFELTRVLVRNVL